MSVDLPDRHDPYDQWYADPYSLTFAASEHMSKFDPLDVYIIIGVFLIGFLLAFFFSNYFKLRKAKIAEINRRFQGLKGEYEQVQHSLERYVQWKYRMKLLEKIYYVLLLCLGFLFYKSPPLIEYFFLDYPHFCIPCFAVSLVFFSLAGYWFDKKARDQEKKGKNIKDKLKDTKRQLVNHMDPVLVEAVKEIIRKDMKGEIDKIRNSEEQGCALKCRLISQMLRIDVDRNQAIVEALINFKFCDTCKQT